jgi:hypothetical protein
MLSLTIVGDSPLICHRWSDDAKRAMLEKQMKMPKQAREAKNPEKLYEDSLYRGAKGKYVFPAIAFKKAAVDACSHVAEITKVLARGCFHVLGEYVSIEGRPEPREDVVRVGMGTADIRYRGQFPQWSTKLLIRYNSAVLTAAQIINLFNVAGFAIGVGDWRPQRDGNFGMFHVQAKQEK